MLSLVNRRLSAPRSAETPHLLAHADHHTRMAGPAHNAGEHGTRSIVTSKASLRGRKVVISCTPGKLGPERPSRAHTADAAAAHLDHARTVVAHQGRNLSVLSHF